MKRLNEANLININDGVNKPSYDRAKVRAGIVHFGVGNFHRAHQAVYCHRLLESGDNDCGIIGISMRSAKIHDALAPQDFLYTEATLGKVTSYNIISSIVDILIAPESPKAVIDVVKRSQTQLVTTTITEKGYCLYKGGVDFKHVDIQCDMQSLAEPKTIYGYLAAALIERSQSDGSPLTIMCCDNLQGGGEFLAIGTLALIEQHNKACLMWVNKNVNFIASMVDRVTPATDDNLIHQVTQLLEVEDKSPIAAEPFSQWVIEDNFAGTKPAFDKVGANFVVDITEYEQMKLRFLNASHSIIAALGYLLGDTYIHQVLTKVEVLSFTKQALLENILPFTTIPQDADAYQYIEQIIERFQNSALPYGVLQVGTDSSQKIVQRWFPTIDDALNKNHNASSFAFILAAWALYIEQAISNKELNDPLLDEFTKILAETREISVKSLLILTGAENFNFFKNIGFIRKVEEYNQLMSDRGIATALKLFLN